MRATIAFIIVAAAFAGCGGGRPETAVPTNDGKDAAPPRPSVPGSLSDWKETDPLPLLARKLILPVADAADFKISSDGVRYPREPNPKRPTEDPFPTDAAAVAAARAWILAHFGALPGGVSLDLQSVQHSSSGREIPQFDWDRGHTIVFRERFRGIPTDGHSVVYLTGQTQFAASVSLFAYEPIPGSAKPVVGKDVALAAWRARFQKQPNAKELVAQFEKKASPKLKFVWSVPANRGRQGDDVVAPTWILDDEGLIMVDGHTGEAWYND